MLGTIVGDRKFQNYESIFFLFSSVSHTESFIANRPSNERMKWKPISANHREQPTNRGLKSFRQWKVEQKRSGWPRLMVISDRQSIGNENFEKFFVKIARLANGVDLLAAKGAFCNLNVSGLSSLLIYRSFEFQMILLLFFKQERLSIAFPVINNWPLWWKRSDWKSQIETLNRLPSDRARSKDTATRISISAFFSKVWMVFTGYCPGDTVPIERQDWPECELDQTVSQKVRTPRMVPLSIINFRKIFSTFIWNKFCIGGRW